MPALQVSEAEAQTMMALSVMGESYADSSAEVLTKEDDDWDNFGDDEDE